MELERTRALLEVATRIPGKQIAPSLAPPRRPKKGTPTRACSGVMVISDVHAEEVVRERRADGTWLCRHGPAEARHKLRQVVAGALAVADARTQGSYRLDHMTIGLLGDLMTGHLHEDNVETTDMPPSDAAELIYDLVAEALREYVPRTTARTVRIVGVCGNHGRTTAKMRAATAVGHSFEILVYRMLRKHLAGLRTSAGHPVEWVIQDSAITYTREPLGLVRWVHGHEVNYGGGVLGPMLPIAKQVDRWNREPGGTAALTCMGHFHQAELFLGPPSILVNGSLIGVSAYARAKGFGTGVPVQVHLTHSDHHRRLFGLDLLGADAAPILD